MHFVHTRTRTHTHTHLDSKSLLIQFILQGIATTAAMCEAQYCTASSTLPHQAHWHTRESHRYVLQIMMVPVLLPDHPFWGSQMISAQTQRSEGLNGDSDQCMYTITGLPFAGMVSIWPSCGDGSGSSSFSPIVPSIVPLLVYCMSQLKTETSQWTLMSTSSQGSSSSFAGER